MIKEKIKSLLKIVISEKFIRFCIIGIINTIIHLIIYNALRIEYGGTIATTIAFIVASIFSYFANSLYTYKTEIKKKTFFLAMLVFVLKLLLNDGLEFGLSFLFEKVLNLLQLIKFIPIFITALILPFQFLVFNKIFKEPQYEAKDEKVVSSSKV